MSAPAHECLSDALAAAQAEFGPVVKDKTAKVRSKKTTQDGRPIEYTYQYADLSDVIDAVTPALSKHGLAQVQRFRLNGTHQTLVTELRYKAEVLDSEIILPIANSDPQEVGKVITYFRRYALQALLGITAERDDDAADTRHVRQPTPRGEAQQARPAAPREARSQEAVTIDEARINKCRRVVEKELAAGSWAYADPAAGTLSQPFASADEACRDLLDVMAESPPGWVGAAMKANEPLVNAAGDGIVLEMASLHMRKNGGGAASQGAPQ